MRLNRTTFNLIITQGRLLFVFIPINNVDTFSYGVWRLHSKIVPDWLPAREPGKLTYRVPEEAAEEEEQREVAKNEESSDKKDQEEDEGPLDKFGRRLKNFGK